MSNYDRLKNIYKKHSGPVLPIKAGMVLEIHENVGDGDIKRIWKFKGLVIKVKNPNHPGGTFLIRGEVARMTIEKIYPLSFPNFDKVLLLDDYKIRRSKLYYIRDKVGKDARFKSIIENTKRGTDLLDLVKVEEIVENKEEIVEEKIETVSEEVVENKEEIVENVAEVEKSESGEENKE